MVAISNFTAEDVPVLRQFRYPDLQPREILAMIQNWAAKQYQGRYFEMFAVTDDGKVVGSVSLWEQSADAVSCGVEIFEPFRRRGYAYRGLSLVLEYAKEKGYELATSQVRKDNAASVALHRKLGFCLKQEFCNSKGNIVYLFLKK